MTQPYADRLNQIVWEVARAGREGTTRAKIAAALGLKKTPHITQMMRRLVDDGMIVEELNTTAWPYRFRYTVTSAGMNLARQVQSTYHKPTATATA